jgi:dTDP-4-amino-4,6-dideoxygalactose transaminase
VNNPANIPFIDLAAQQERLRSRIDQAIGRVLDQGAYIMGPDVKQIESELAAFSGAKHVVSCGNGTDALQLGLMALGVGAGDAVFVPTFTFAATAEVVPLLGATPVFVDSRSDTFNMDPDSLRRAVAEAKRQGLRPRVVIPVDLFGLSADMPTIEAVAAEFGLDVLCDSAQGFGSTIDGRMTGTFGRLTTTSFFPAKPLGCYGDGGALFTDDEELAQLLDSLRVHGKGTDKYDNARVGLNSRLDTLQAAILSVKLSVYADEIDARNRVANRYTDRLSNLVGTQFVPQGYRSVWAQYTMTLDSSEQRKSVQAALSAEGVPSVVYYPNPLHLQTIYRDYPRDPEGLASAEDLSRRVLSLPMHPYLEASVQDRVIDVLTAAVTAARKD